MQSLPSATSSRSRPPTLNFGQGDALMLGAMVGLTLVNMGVNYWLMVPLVIVSGCAGHFGRAHRCAPAIKIKSEFGWIMSTIALGIIFKNVASETSGADDLKFPSPAKRRSGAGRQHCRWKSGGGRRVLMLAVEFFNRKNNLRQGGGRHFNDRDAAKLMGINTGLVITFSYHCRRRRPVLPAAPATLTAPPWVGPGLKAFCCRHHRRADQRHGHHRRRHHSGRRQNHHRLFTAISWLQGRPDACCCCAGIQAG
jgi:branched-chain amino acid transport system permease protein